MPADQEYPGRGPWRPSSVEYRNHIGVAFAHTRYANSIRPIATMSGLGGMAE